MKPRDILGLSVRYLVLALLGLFNLKLFYLVFTPLTVYPSFWVISLFNNSARLLEGNLLFFSGFYAELIPACIAGAAYYLLLILNLTTPMDKTKRTKSILFLLLSFLVLNILRILIFSGLLVFDKQYFDLAHNAVWYFGSTILIILIWFANVFLFKIKAIPVYTDMKNLFYDVKAGRNKRK